MSESALTRPSELWPVYVPFRSARATLLYRRLVKAGTYLTEGLAQCHNELSKSYQVHPTVRLAVIEELATCTKLCYVQTLTFRR
jgi:hypothetical protein